LTVIGQFLTFTASSIPLLLIVDHALRFCMCHGLKVRYRLKKQKDRNLSMLFPILSSYDGKFFVWFYVISCDTTKYFCDTTTMLNECDGKLIEAHNFHESIYLTCY